ncbi:MAG: hypothetical protein ACYDCL_21520 [Myxococcales bacterium]
MKMAALLFFVAVGSAACTVQVVVPTPAPAASSGSPSAAAALRAVAPSESPSAPPEPGATCVDSGTIGGIALDGPVFLVEPGYDFGMGFENYIVAQGTASRGGICGTVTAHASNFELSLPDGAVMCADAAGSTAAARTYGGTPWPIEVGPYGGIPVVLAFKGSLLDMKGLYSVDAILSRDCVPTNGP